MNGYLAAPLDFIIGSLFGLYILAVMLRFLLGLLRASFYNPLAQFLVKVTNPPLRPLRRVIPGLFGVDFASVLLLVVLQVAALWFHDIIWGKFHPAGWLLARTAVELVDLTFLIFLGSIFIQAILSWVNQGGYNPVYAMLSTLNEPLLRPARRLVPPVSGFDLSPMVVLILLYALRMLVMSLLNQLVPPP